MTMKKFIKLIGVGVVAAAIMCSCKDATMAQFHALGRRHSITLYAANGTVIKHWVSTGNVSNEDRSDGWYFEDEATHLLVEVTGTLVIEVIP